MIEKEGKRNGTINDICTMTRRAIELRIYIVSQVAFSNGMLNPCYNVKVFFRRPNTFLFRVAVGRKRYRTPICMVNPRKILLATNGILKT